MTDVTEDWSIADPFDLPEWLGEQPLQWSTREAETGARIEGVLTSGSGEVDLDLLCVDVAFPAVALGERLRHDAHQAWHFGQVLLLVREDRHALAVPTTRWDADIACEAMRRFAKAIGVPASHISVLLRL
jgi:hypothetical protein